MITPNWVLIFLPLTKDQRTARNLMRKRMQLVQQSTLNLQSIQGLYARHLNKKISSNKITTSGYCTDK
jgi:hypothetical protein